MKVRRGDPCTIENCGKPVVGRGWCSMHYARWRKYGDPLYEVRPYTRQDSVCSVEGCAEPPHGLGLCNVHHSRHRTHGETTAPYERKFWAKVDRRGDDECWEWKGYVQSNGYGNFGQTGTRLAHRIAYRLLVGPIPEGTVLDHLCHTRDPNCADADACPHRRCVNPTHLDPTTRRINIARGRGGDSWGYVPDPLPAKPKRAPKPTICTEPGCERSVYKRTICRPHYRKWLKDPAVERPSQRTPEQRFWEKVEKTSTCWLWTAYINPSTGYGHFGVKHGVMVGAHRFAYELVHGSVSDGMDVHHTCLTRRCVRWDHLAAVSRAENLRLRANRRT